MRMMFKKVQHCHLLDKKGTTTGSLTDLFTKLQTLSVSGETVSSLIIENSSLFKINSSNKFIHTGFNLFFVQYFLLST